jgi:murein DD-endopeptidase MepM/ murein hydrolase activator NlpD
MGVRRAAALTLVFLLSGCGHHKPAPVYDLKLAGRSSGTALVTPGDNLTVIDKRYGLTLEDLIGTNMMSGDVLHPGQRLALPPPHRYTVRKGDTLPIIAAMFDVRTADITRLNHLKGPIHVGQVLKMPGQSTRVAMPAPHTAPRAAARIVMPNEVKTNLPILTGHGNGMFAVPVQGQVVSAYGPKGDGLYNDGINIAAAPGTPVRAAGDGTIVYAGHGLEGYGNLVLIRHDNGYFTVYSHLAESHVAKGATVKRGQSIGSVGSSGKVTTPQLHFELRKGTESLDPLGYL